MLTSLAIFTASACSILNQRRKTSRCEREYMLTGRVTTCLSETSAVFDFGKKVWWPKITEEIIASAMKNETYIGIRYHLPSHLIPVGGALFSQLNLDRGTHDIKVIGTEAQVDAYVRRYVYGVRPRRLYLTLPALIVSAYCLLSRN